MAHAWRTGLFTIKGVRSFLKDGYERHAKSFQPADLQADLSSKHALVTGANQGLGYATSLELAKRGASVTLVCRNKERGEAAVTSIKAATGNERISLIVADLGLLRDVKRVADTCMKCGAPLHLLVNNAGALIDPRTETAEGLESNFAVNTMAGFLLTETLLPLLRASAPSRAVFVSSGGQYTESLHLDDMQWKKEGGFNGARQYGAYSKPALAQRQHDGALAA
jgi:dehydrogenase/reductase SDR family protein 12